MRVQRIIAEKSGAMWRAWFSDTPEIAFVSESPFSAIDYLVSLSPDKQVDASALYLDEERSTETHREFLGLVPSHPSP